MCKIPHEQHPYLIDPRRRKSRADGSRHRGSVPSLANDGIDFVIGERRLGGVGPNLVPVYIAGCCRPSANDVEDEFGPIQDIKMLSWMLMSITIKQTYGFSSAPQ